MPSRPLFWIGWSLIACGPAGATGGSAAGDPLGSLDAAAVQELFQWLSRHAANPDALSQEALNRAALRSLLADGGTGAVLLTKAEATSAAAAPPPALLARLGETSAYVRLGGLDESSIASLRAFLDSLPSKVSHLILDLRVPLPAGPLAQAVALTSLFVPPDTPLFQVVRGKPAAAEAHRSHGPLTWNRELWLLTDDTTPPVLELAAQVMVRQGGALTLGSPTRGLLTETIDRPLGTDHILRLPSATACWPDGSRLSGLPLVAMIPVKPAADSRAALLALRDPAVLELHLTETDRPRPNEAALMAGLPPELLTGRAAPTSTPAPHPLRPDPVLQQAWDLLQTSRFLKLDAPEEIKRAEPGP
jgi:hypothetical protein